MLSTHNVPPPTPVEPDGIATGDSNPNMSDISSHDLMVALQVSIPLLYTVALNFLFCGWQFGKGVRDFILSFTCILIWSV